MTLTLVQAGTKGEGSTDSRTGRRQRRKDFGTGKEVGGGGGEGRGEGRSSCCLMAVLRQEVTGSRSRRFPECRCEGSRGADMGWGIRGLARIGPYSGFRCAFITKLRAWPGRHYFCRPGGGGGGGYAVPHHRRPVAGRECRRWRAGAAVLCSGHTARACNRGFPTRGLPAQAARPLQSTAAPALQWLHSRPATGRSRCRMAQQPLNPPPPSPCGAHRRLKCRPGPKLDEDAPNP